MNRSVKRLIYFLLFAAYISYSVFVYTSGTYSEISMSSDARSGKIIFQENNCIACHQLYGLGGYMGPDLTEVISKRGEIYVRSFIENGTEKMPDFDLTKKETDQLIEYLQFVDSTSAYPLKDVEVTWYGTVNKNQNNK